MTFFKTISINTVMPFLVAMMWSSSTMVSDFEDTQRLAIQGDADAQFSLGLKYQKGESISQDYSKAVEWYTRAANQDHVEAIINLGYMYDTGKGARQDYVKARKLYLKAASQGEAEAQHNLGSMYYKGEGVTQNTATAKEWFNKACDDGFENSCDAYRMLNDSE